ncbi:hypothetical protein P8452_73408 [Trifolium repens]|nr:hypothetical protein P8452_73408 [Trifolium repens]
MWLKLYRKFCGIVLLYLKVRQQVHCSTLYHQLIYAICIRKDATVDFEDVGHSDSAIEIMEKYFVGEVDTTTLPAEAKKNTPPPVQATTLNNQSSGFLLKFLQYLVPLFVLGFAFALQYYGEKSKSNES